MSSLLDYVRSGQQSGTHAHKSPEKPDFGRVWTTSEKLALQNMYLGCVTALLMYGDPCVTVTHPYISPCAYSTYSRDTHLPQKLASALIHTLPPTLSVHRIHLPI
jgi:hypothetical protein